MALQLNSKQAAPKTKPSGKKDKVKGKIKTKTKSKEKVSFLMKGQAAKKLLDEAQQQAKVRKEQMENGVFRFWLKEGAEKTVTFLDGELDSDGDLDNPICYEHSVNNKALRYPKYPCINDPANGVECPLCEGGNDPYLVAYFTVIVHEEWYSKKDKRSYDGRKQLFAAKLTTLELLKSKAKKYGGLKGATFDIKRTSSKVANVGDDFDYMQTDKLKKIAKSFPGIKCEPYDYSEIIQYHSRKELIKLGYGANNSSTGNEDAADEDSIV